jgi:hypothetical protein
MNTQILIKQPHYLFGDAAHYLSIILFIPLILSKFLWAASINGMVAAKRAFVATFMGSFVDVTRSGRKPNG